MNLLHHPTLEAWTLSIAKMTLEHTCDVTELRIYTANPGRIINREPGTRPALLPYHLQGQL